MILGRCRTIRCRAAHPAWDLAAQKKAAGIEDCPASDDAVPVVSSGLPSVILGCLGGGRKVRLAGLRGEPMMINVWAQWCGPCREEAPYISEVAAANESELMILGIDYNDPRPGTRRRIFPPHEFAPRSGNPLLTR